MRRTVVDDPKDTACGAVRFLNHDLIHKAAESSAAIGRFTVSENPGVMDIPSRQIDPSTEAFIVGLQTHRLMRLGWRAGMFRLTRLNAGLLVCGENKIVRIQWSTFPSSGVEIQYASRFDDKIRIARKQPRSESPWLDCILTEPAPECGFTDVRHNALFNDLAADFRIRKP